MSDSINEHNLGSYMDHALSLNSYPTEQTAQHRVAAPRRPPPEQKSSPVAVQPPPHARLPPQTQAKPHPQVNSPKHGSPSSPTRRVPGYLPQKDSYNIKGASQQTRKIVDSQGNVQVRTIRKGVEDFDFADELGAGSYSTVVAASDKQTLRKYAIKILDKVHIIKEDKVKYVEIEKNTLNRLGDHPGIIQLYYTFQDRASLFFVLDYAPNGELLHLIKQMGSLDIPCSRYYAAQLLDAVQYMHDNGVIHRDLKPENILLDYKMRIKITDFGTAKLLDAQEDGKYPEDTRAKSFVGTAEYVSPELLTAKYQGKSCDLWAIGCVLYQMIAGQPPFQGSTQYLTFQRIVQYQYKVPPGFPFLVRDLLKNVLVPARKRWSVTQMKEHPLFEGVDWSMKALWGNPPPKIQPYKPTPSSMAAPPGAVGLPQPRARPPPPQQQASNSHLPTAQRARPSSPATQPQPQQQQRHNQLQSQSQPQHHQHHQQQQHHHQHTTSHQQQHLHRQQQQQQQAKAHPQQPPRMTPQEARQRAAQTPRVGSSQSSSAAAAALYRKPNMSAGYSQGQERLEAIKKQVMEQRPASRGTSGEYRRPIVSTNGGGNNARRSGERTRVESPVSPHAGSPTTMANQAPANSVLDQEWSFVLTSRNERILKLDTAQIGTISSGEGEGDTESKFIKLFSSKKKNRTVIVTSFGRLLLLNEERKVKGEIMVGAPQVRVRRIERAKGGLMYIVDTYTRTITLEGLVYAEQWQEVFDQAKLCYEQIQIDAERNARGAATAAAIAVAQKR